MSVIRPNTMGKFKDLLMATAKSPAMLVYLDNFQSMHPNPQPAGRRGNGPGSGQRWPGGVAAEASAIRDFRSACASEG